MLDVFADKLTYVNQPVLFHLPSQKSLRNPDQITVVEESSRSKAKCSLLQRFS
jgi:hypothetical protein